MNKPGTEPTSDRETATGRAPRLLLLSARVASTDAETAEIREILRNPVDWTHFAQFAIDSKLTALAGHTLARVAPDLVPNDILEALRLNVIQERAKNRVLLGEMAGIVRALTAGGVDAVALKGPTLALQAYGDLAFRASSNFDLLIREADLSHALAALRLLGYERAGQLSTEQQNLIHRLEGQEPLSNDKGGPVIRLHTRVAPLKLSLNVDYSGLWGRAQREDFGGHSFLILAPEDALVALAIQYGHNSWSNLRWASDIAAIAAMHPTLEWTALAEGARKQACFRMVLLATSLARRSFGASIPETLAAAQTTDTAVDQRAERIVTHWQAGAATNPPPAVMPWLHDGPLSRVRNAARNLFLPDPAEIASKPLPRSLSLSQLPTTFARNTIVNPVERRYRRLRERLRRKRQRTAGAPLEDTAAWREKAVAMVDAGRRAEALDLIDKALALDSGDARTWAVRARILQESSRYLEAIDASDQALSMDPNNIAAARDGILSRLQSCDWRRRDADKQRVSDGIKAGQRIISPFFHRNISGSEAESLSLARLMAKRFPPSPAPLWQGQLYRHDRIRIAYVSTDFRDHVVSDAIAGTFERHDKAHFKTIGVSLGPNDGSKMRQRIEAALDQFVDASHMNDADVAALIREWEIDLLVDLNGYSGAHRPGILAQRPAPLQVNYLGYPGTTALPFVDYIVADHTVIPDAHHVFYSEKVAFLPDAYLPNDRQRRIADRVPSRAEIGLPPAGFVFACHNASHKIGPELFEVWMRLLGAVDGSVLWLRSMNAATIVNLRREASARGVSPERLLFAPRIPNTEDHLSRLALADLFVDTLPYNAHASASDALWAGLPVLTCLGTSFQGRVAASLLHSIGLPELVTTSLTEYEDLARALAQDRARLTTIKAKLRRKRDTAPLFDTARFTRYLESAYATMLERQRAGLPPTSFTVDR